MAAWAIVGGETTILEKGKGRHCCGPPEVATKPKSRRDWRRKGRPLGGGVGFRYNVQGVVCALKISAQKKRQM